MAKKTKKAKKTTDTAATLRLSADQLLALRNTGRGVPATALDGRTVRSLREKGLVTGVRVVKRTLKGSNVLALFTGNLAAKRAA